MSNPFVYEFDIETDDLPLETHLEILRKIEGVLSVSVLREKKEMSWPAVIVVVGGPDFQKAQDALTEMFAESEVYEEGLGLFEVTG